MTDKTNIMTEMKINIKWALFLIVAILQYSFVVF